MAFFNGLKDRAMDVAHSGISRSKKLAEVVKLKAANLSEEDNLKKAYLEVGKLYYAERGMTPEAAYAALCEKITACKVNIEENNARIEELRQGDDGSVDGEDDIVLEDVAVQVEDIDEAGSEDAEVSRALEDAAADAGAEDETAGSEAVKDETVKDEAVEDEAVEDEAVEDEAAEDEPETKTPVTEAKEADAPISEPLQAEEEPAGRAKPEEKISVEPIAPKVETPKASGEPLADPDMV